MQGTKSGVLLVACLLAMSLLSQAQTVIVDYDVTSSGNIAENGYAPRFTQTGFTASNLSLNGNVGAGPFQRHYHTTNWDATQNTSKYIAFTITPSTAVEFLKLDLTLFRFADINGGSTGGSSTVVAIRSSIDSFAANIDGTRTETNLTGSSNQEFDLTGLARQTGAVTFRIYFWGDPEGGWAGQAANSSNLGMRVVSAFPPAPTNLAVTDDTGLSGSDGVTMDNTLSFAGTAAASTTIEVFLDAGSLGTTIAAGNGSWSFDHTGTTLADATYAFTATSTNDLGNTSALSNSFALMVDTTAPKAPSITGFTPDSGAQGDGLSNAQALTLSGMTEPNARVTVFDGPTNLGNTVANGSGAWSFMTGSLSEDSHTFTAQTTDVAGNLGVASADFVVTLDRTAPAAPTVDNIIDDAGSSSSDAITFDRILTFVGTAEANASVEVFIAGASIGTTTANSSGDWTFDHPATLTEAVHAVTARATDAAANESPASSALMVTIDITIPAPPSVDAVTDDTGRDDRDQITNDNTLEIMGMTEAGALIEVFVDGNSVGTTTADGSGAWTFDYTGTTLSDDTYAFTAKATDIAGNPGLVGSALTVTIDTMAPAAPSDPDLDAAYDSGSFDDDDLTNINSPSFTGTCEALAIVQLSSDRQGTVKPSLTSGASGDWTIVLTDKLQDDVHAITATAEDVAGNISNASGALSVEIDTVTAKPSFDFERDTDMTGDLKTFDRSLVFFGSAEVDAAFELTRDGSSIGTGTVDSQGAWMVDDSATLLDVGAMPRYEIFVTDVAGNMNDEKVTLDIQDIIDRDGDGLSDYEEMQLGTDADKQDSDGDGIGDGIEVVLGTSPTDIDDPVAGGDNPDRDHDGIPDSFDSDPDDPDSDMDGVVDGYEVQLNQSLDLSLPNSLGDANSDDVVDFDDVRTILGVIAGNMIDPGVSITDLDMNNNGKVDRQDAMLLLYFLRELTDLLPLRR